VSPARRRPDRVHFGSGLIAVVVSSFGYRHLAAGEAAPEAHLTVDLRELLRDPHTDPAMRELTGLDLRVRAKVMGIDGAAVLADRLVAVIEQLLMLRAGEHGLVRLAVGCCGGRHRSVALAEWIAEVLRVDGLGVEVKHHHIDQPVIRRQLPGSGAA
jgi:RNase adaptor protein for sRNA GlmZ degradation